MAISYAFDVCHKVKIDAAGKLDWNNSNQLPVADILSCEIGEIETLLYWMQRICDLLDSSGVSLVAQSVKNPPAMQETQVRSLGWKDPLEKEMGIWTLHTGQLRGTYAYLITNQFRTKIHFSSCLYYFTVAAEQIITIIEV